MSTETPRDPEGTHPSHGIANREESSDEQNLDWSNWRPNLEGPPYQPTGGPNGTPISIAIGTPGRILSESEKEQWAAINREMDNADIMILPDDDDDHEEPGPPHIDPVDGADTASKLGKTGTNWEVWRNKNGRNYYYHRATNTTKYSWRIAEIEADEQGHAHSSAERKLPIRTPNDEDDSAAPGTRPGAETERGKVGDL